MTKCEEHLQCKNSSIANILAVPFISSKNINKYILFELEDVLKDSLYVLEEPNESLVIRTSLKSRDDVVNLTLRVSSTQSGLLLLYVIYYPIESVLNSDETAISIKKKYKKLFEQPFSVFTFRRKSRARYTHCRTSINFIPPYTKINDFIESKNDFSGI